MAKVYLICGKICCGKTTYAEKLCAEATDCLRLLSEQQFLSVLSSERFYSMDFRSHTPL